MNRVAFSRVSISDYKIFYSDWKYEHLDEYIKINSVMMRDGTSALLREWPFIWNNLLLLNINRDSYIFYQNCKKYECS